jgi:hypothetical protein
LFGDRAILSHPEPLLDEPGTFRRKADEFTRPAVTLLHAAHTVE